MSVVSAALGACDASLHCSVKNAACKIPPDQLIEAIKNRRPGVPDALVLRFRTPAAVDRLSAALALCKWGLGERAVRKVVSGRDARMLKAFRVDPFGESAKAGASLAEADAVATAVGTTRPDRILGHVAWAVDKAARDGDTLAPLAPLVAKFGDRDVRALADRGKFVIFGDHVTTNDRYEAEAYVAGEIKRRAKQAFMDPGALDFSDPGHGHGHGEGLVPEQLEAARAVTRASIVALVGPPGSGKSRLVRAIVDKLGVSKCMLTAPTGRCARALEGRTVHSHTARAGARTETAHRRPIQETSALPDDLVLLACDESSMLTVELMASVLRLAPPTCHVLLIGDEDQLPPVGAGNVLSDILASGACPIVRLAHNHRNAPEVSALANAVLRGTPGPPNGPPDGPSNPVKFASHGSVVPHAIAGAQPLVYTNAVRTQLNREIQCAKALARGPVDVVIARGWRGFDRGQRATMYPSPGSPPGPQVLVQVVVGDRRVEVSLSEAVEACDSVPTGKLASEPRVFLAVGDPVIVLKNQPAKPGERPVCNGDVGVLVDFGADRAIVDFGADGGVGGVVKFKPGCADKHLTLAHALTVHKAQGGEFESVVIPVPPGGTGWSRSLLYTAITRAKRSVTIIGSVSDVRAISSRTPPKRVTMLRRLLSVSD